MKSTFSLLLACLITSISGIAQITSTFDTDADGWTFSNNGTPITVNHNATNGNPGGFVASAPYASNTSVASQGWFAPAKFLGPQALRSYGMNLHFDLQQAFAGTNSSVQGDVRIETTTNDDIVFSLPVKPAVAPAWSSYTIKLDETGGWRSLSAGGALATQADILRALANIKTIEIRGTYITNAANVVGIDNVILEQKALALAPAVTSFSPQSGIPGASVTINGNNFGATAAQNAVYFGTTKATITSGNATQLTVTIPAGAKFGPITVINLTTGLSKQSSQAFSPRFDNNKDFGGRIIPSSLDLKDDINLPAGSGGITGLDVGDLDGDGLADIIATEIKTSPTAYQELLVFRNLGITGDINASSFAPKIVLGQSADDCSVIDLDGDGKLDIVGHYSLGFSHYFITYRNISTPGNIAFEAPESFEDLGLISRDLHVADLDGDGRPDLMGTHPNVGLYYYFGIAQNLSVPGDILFGSVVTPDLVITSSTEISTGDLTGDGKLDIVVSNGGAFRLFQNQSTPGTISLAPPVLIDPTNNVTNVEIADLDNDGKLDLSWASGVAASAIRIRKNIYSGGVLDASSFDPEVVISSPAYAPTFLTIADINGDGKLDMVTSGGRDLAIFENTFSGTLNANSFQAPVLFQGTTFITNLLQPVIADLDGDNKPDLVTATSGSSALQIFIFRNTSFPAPVINSFTPATGEAGTSFTLTGNFMNTALESPNVKIGLTSATTSAVNNTSVTSTIPAGATSGRVSVNLHGLTAYSKPLNVTFPTSRTINISSFITPIEFPLAVATDGLTVADFDNDGKTDVVVNDNNTFRIFRNTVASNGNPISASSLTGIVTTYTGTTRATATDIDGDGKIDLLANGLIHRNNSGTTADAISFEPSVSHIISGANGFAVRDFNQDGKSDFAYTTNGNTYEVDENASRQGPFTNFGGGVFSTIVNSGIGTGAGGQVMGITAGDFDDDGYEDFAFGANAGADFLAVVRNTGLNQALVPAQFAPAVTFPALDIPFSIASADFDGDGKLDIVLGNNNAAFISIYRNTSTTGSISFLDKQDIAALTRAIDIEAVDLDGDGKPEIIVAHQPTSTTGSFTVFQNTSTSGTISFAAGINYPLSRGPLSLAIADINLDAKPDLIFAANGTTDALVVFENKISSILINITQQPASPYYACEGGTATFTTAASGTTNITYQWQKFDGSVFVDLANSTTFSGVTSPTLTINNVSSSESGEYQCVISGDFAATVTTVAADLVFNSLPSPPDVVNGVSCGPGVVLLTASGGSPGDYRWYSGSPLTLIAGEQNETLITPSLTANTTYHVSLTDTFCESVPVQVTAIISTPPAKPVITASVTPVGGEITACESTVLTLSAPAGFTDYQWFDTSGYPFASTQTVTILDSDVYSVLVVNADGCSSEESDALTVTIVPEPCTNTAPVITTSTLSTTLGQSVSVDLLNLISDADGNLVLSSLTIVQQPQSGASASINGTNLLIDYNGLSFTGLDVIRISVCDLFGECTEQTLEINVIGEIEIFNAVSPNGDDKNPYFTIENIEALEPDNTVTIYNRWGSKVFEVENYKEANAFRGLNQNGNELPSGTYFYKIFFKSSGKTTNGFLVLKR